MMAAFDEAHGRNHTTSIEQVLYDRQQPLSFGNNHRFFPPSTG
jgi:hypothetical protein